MNKFSLIIPCYNEQNNIDELTNQIIYLNKRVSFDAILIDNGSNDETRKELIKVRENKKIKNLELVFIDKNIGFGNAIKKGILKSRNDLICYTHADLQTDLNDVLTASEPTKADPLEGKIIPCTPLHSADLAIAPKFLTSVILSKIKKKGCSPLS